MFKEQIGAIADVKAAIALLSWDQEVYMPPKGAMARGFQLATLSGIAHRMLTGPELGASLNELKGKIESLNADERALVEETGYDYERATKLPESFVHTFALETSRALEVWVKARQTSEFALFQPNLERLVELLRQKADLLGYAESPYDALLEEFERGMTARELDRIFGELQPKQTAILEAALRRNNEPPPWLHQTWPVDAQWGFTLNVVRELGYDLEAGRQDRSVHPFTTSFDLHDVRITTRFNPDELFSGVMGSIHETGHALYEQGYPLEDRRTTLAQAPSLGIHESQSRMWENIIGRSLPFWRYALPKLRTHFPGQLDKVTAEQVYAALNCVRPSFIRVEADECTYNLHVILRYEIERALIEGDMAVKDIPEAWNAKMKSYLGVDVPNDAMGCRQDIHWSHGAMGYFPTYALGNLYAAQLFETMRNDIPEVWEKVESGEFNAILEWLREKVHRVGRRKTAVQIVRDATGHEPTADAYLNYLEQKYA